MAKERTLTSNLQDTNLVQKSRPLSLIRSVPFSYGELRILDTYLSRIDSHDIDHRTVTFTKAEFEELMGIGKVNLQTLRKYTKGLLQKVVDVPLPGGYMQFVLFDEAECKKDEYGVPIITLTCKDKAQRLFFDIEQIGYIRYQLRYALALKRQSSYWLYFEILRERYRGEWTVPLKKLRDEILYLKNEQSYKQFKFFRHYVLDPAVEEINEKTDVNISYVPKKRGRTVTDIVFTYHASETLPGQVYLSDIDGNTISDLPPDAVSSIPEYLVSYAKACDDVFAIEEIEALYQAVQGIPEQRLPVVDGDLDHRRVKYMAAKYAEVKAYQNRKKIKSPFKYLLAVIKNDSAKQIDTISEQKPSFDIDRWEQNVKTRRPHIPQTKENSTH